MPPRSHTLRPAQTASAREAMRSFFCELCQKGYSRMNEYEAHLSSYDHSHKQRLKDMKAMVRDPAVVARARRQEAKADAVISIKLGGPSSTIDDGADSAGGGGPKKGGFRKGGFKSAFVAATDVGNNASASNQKPASVPVISLPPASTTPSAGTSSGTNNAAPHTIPALPQPLPLAGTARDPYEESDTDNEGYEVYDPRHPTD